MKAIRVFAPGSADALTVSDVALPSPAQGQIRVKVSLAGVNFIDVYHRRGQYALPMPPSIGTGIGIEGIGELAQGQKVFWLSALGSYAQEVNVSKIQLTPLPHTTLTNEEILPLLCQGMTAHYLVHSAHHVNAGEWVLVTAAAGGVGLLLTQLLKNRGANVIALSSTAERAQIAKEHGADVVGIYDQMSTLVSTATNGAGVNIVFDSIGKDYFDNCLDSLAPSGMYLLYGGASGPVPPFDLMRLNAKSLAIRRPTLATYTSTEIERLDRLSDLLSLAEGGKLRYPATKVFPLSEAQRAHELLESRRYSGKIGLDPWRI